MPCPGKRTFFAITLIMIVSLAHIAMAEPGPLAQDIIRLSGFEKNAIQQISDGVLVRELDVADRDRQAAFAGLIKIRDDASGLARSISNPPREAPSGKHPSGRFSDPATIEDVATLRFSEDEMEIMAECRVASCKFKLSKSLIDELSQIDWSRADATEQFTQRFRMEAVGYVQGYLDRGNQALIVYNDKAKPLALADTLESLLSWFEGFRHYAPGLTGYLSTFPLGGRPSIEESLVWAIKDFGYRPTLMIDQLMVDREPEADGVIELVSAKTIYAGHYIAGRIQMGAVLDGEIAFGTPGRFLLVVDRIDFDDSLGGIKRSLLGRGLKSDLKGRMRMLRGLANANP